MPSLPSSVRWQSLALWLVLPSPALAQAAHTAEFADVEFIRCGGADRYATSLLVAEAYAAQAGGKLDSAVLVSGQSWRSAVMAASLAGKLGAPMLMAPPDRLRDDAGEFLWRGADRWDRQFVGIDMWDRDAVPAAYEAEFNRKQPDSGFTGDVQNCVANIAITPAIRRVCLTIDFETTVSM